MNPLNILNTSLLDLLWEVRNTGISLILGGGYGIFLKSSNVREQGLRSLLEELPESRSTSDLDLFLRPELLVHANKLKPLSAAIKNLGYTVVETARNYQFVKPGPGGVGIVKIDMLTGPRDSFQGTNIKVDKRRAHPNPSVGLHAHPVDEALILEEGLWTAKLSGSLSTGLKWEHEVFLPHSFSFLLMKLFAFKDRVNDASKEYGRYHALDLYTIVATTTEKEWDDFTIFNKRLRNNQRFLLASAIVDEYFSTLTKVGLIRLRESRYYRPGLQLDKFISILQEAFPV